MHGEALENHPPHPLPSPPREVGDAGVAGWLRNEATQQRDNAAFTLTFAQRLIASGLPIWRLTTGVPILHPQIDSLSYLWEDGHAVVERRYRLDPEGAQRRDNSPMALVYAGERFRWRPDASVAAPAYPILADLEAVGATDYLALPLRFSDGTWKAVTYATRRPGGFAQAELASLENLSPLLSMVLEIRALHHMARTLVDTYVGSRAGARILEGAIKRGMHQRIEAVIWLSDLRAFSRLSEQLPAEELLLLLDDYFGAATDAVSAQGGEVLKFIGDAVLAIFPFAGDERATVAGRAIAAARDMRRRIVGANGARIAAGRAPIDFGLGLHAGEVFYGNIGGTDRLDFTVIGPAVNVAARLESLCKPLGRDILVSEELAALCRERLEPLGSHVLMGMEGSWPVFALPFRDPVQ